MYQLTWCTCMLGNYQSCTSAMLQLTVTLTVGETTICLLCWSYCLCREVASDGGEGSSPTLSSRNNCNDGTTGIVHVHTNHNMHVATGITHVHVYTNHRMIAQMYVYVGSSPTRGSSFFLGKVTALGVLCCFALFVCLTLLASFFLPSHLSLKHVQCTYKSQHTCTMLYMYMYMAIIKLTSTY